MPFTKHIIEPINISQCPLPPGEPNELECLSNLTLANVIRQLSSLGQHAGRIFDELSKDAVSINNRTLIMHQRIENLKVKCQQLDIQSEEVSLTDFKTKKQFKSSVKIDQQVVSRKSMPEAMKIMYNNADPPPALDKLNPYRTDGKDCMKFYTDPEFFFNIWCNELFKDNETKNQKKRRKIKSDKQPNQHNQQQLIKSGQIPNISNPILNGKPQSNEESYLYKQQQLLLMNQNGMKNSSKQQFTHYIQQQQQYFINEFDEQTLPSPPPVQHQQINYEIYAEANQKHITNGGTIHRNQIRTNPSNNQQTTNNKNQKIYSSERPILPPPPVPAQNHLSDLQQIQQQMIKKKQTDYGQSPKGKGSIDNDHSDNNNLDVGDLPPPPSPPSHITNHNNQNMNGIIKSNNTILPDNQQQIHKLTTAQNLITKMSLTEPKDFDSPDFDMPLPPPPPPMEIQDSYMQNLPPPLPDHTQQQQQPQYNGSHLPPPPPLPPLVESDTVSTASSASISNTPTQQSNNTSKNDEIKAARGNFLDDISQRRFQLKSSKKENGSNGNNSVISDSKENADTIQPFVNNSDVAAIIDFIRKFRPHVRDSSEEDEENSDWDD